jgi:peptide/nickel transport system permease protein
MGVEAPDTPPQVASLGGLEIATTAAKRRRARRAAWSLELWIPVGFLVLMVLACFVWPEIYHLPSPTRGNLAQPLVPPLSPGHLLGTDQVGNDILSRLLYGGRVSLEVGLGTTAIGIFIGGGLGTLAAVRGGAFEAVVMRILEIFLSFPSLVLAIVVSTYLGPSELHVIWAISFFAIPAFGRLARANTLRVRGQTFVLAATLLGTRDRRMLFRHIAPNVAPQLMTFGLLGIGVAIMVEAALSFLGLGVPPPAPSWGNMISAGQAALTSAPDLVLIPSAFLFATVLALNLVGDALRTRWGLH